MDLDQKGVSPVVGTILLVVITVLMTGTIGLTIQSMGTDGADKLHNTIKIKEGSKTRIIHEGGDTIPKAITLNNNGNIENWNNLKVKVTGGTAQPTNYKGDNTTDFKFTEKIRINGEWEEGNRIIVIYEPANQILIEKTMKTSQEIIEYSSISGTVTDTDGNPIDGITVTVDGTGLSDTTDADGSYTIENVPTGTYDVIASHEDYIDSTKNVELTENEDANNLNFSLDESEFNEAPNADFDYSPSNPKTDESIDFTDQSNDPDGSISSYEWNFGDGSTSTNQNPSHSYSDDGTYTVTLTVTDDDGATNIYSNSVNVNNKNPSANYTHDGPALTDNNINFNASGSSDPDGSISNYEWDWDNDGTYEESDNSLTNPSHSWSDNGTKKVTLRVTDDDGATSTTSKTIQISEESVAPEITEFNVTDNSSQHANSVNWYPEYKIEWEVQDSNNDLNQIELKLLDDKEDPIDSKTISDIKIPEGSASGNNTLESNDKYKVEVELVILVTDDAGNTNSTSVTDTLDGTGP